MATNIKLGKQEENLSEANIQKVIELLEAEKSITKKLACELLCISYNTTRLATIIEKYKTAIEFRNKRKAEKRGTPATKDEIEYTIKEYMTGSPVSSISAELFRGPTFIAQILENHNVPRRPASQDYFKPELIPDSAVRTEFSIGEKVYSARYDSLARIERLVEHKSEKVYAILLLDDKWKMNAYQPASELASLQHLTAMGIKL
jgi:hypothetical protein